MSIHDTASCTKFLTLINYGARQMFKRYSPNHGCTMASDDNGNWYKKEEVDAALKSAEALKPSHNSQSKQSIGCVDLSDIYKD